MKQHILKVIPKSAIGRSVLVLMSGTALAQIITAVSMPIVTRLYSPEMIGVISIYLSFFNFWLTLLTWRYESAILVTENEEESHHVFRLGAVLALFTAFLAIPILAGLQYSGILGFDVLPIWAPLVAFLSLLGFGWFMLYRSWLLRLRDVRIISISAVARSGANAGMRVLAGGVGLGIHGLFFAEIIGSWSALAAVRSKTKKLLKGPIPEWKILELKKVAVRYKKFAQYEMPSAVVNQLAIALPVLFVGALYGAEAAGWFGLARLLYAIPNGQIGKAAGDVFQMELSRCVREKEYKKGERLFYQFSSRLAIVGLISMIVAIFVAPPLIPYIFGDDWKEMGDIVAHMAPWMFFALIVSSMSRALSVLEKQEWKLLYDMSSLFIVLLAYYIYSINNSELIDFIAFLSLGMSIAYSLYFIIIAMALRRNP